jgi:hypothetical protein
MTWRIQDISTSSLERSDRRQTSREGQWPGRAQAALVQVRCSSGRGHEAGTRTRLLLLVVLRCFCFGLRDARAGQGVVRGLGGRREGGRVWWRREGEERRSGCRRWWADDVGQPVKAEVDGGGSAKGATEARGDVNDRRTERRTERQAAQAQIGRGSKDSVAWRSTENALLTVAVL